MQVIYLWHDVEGRPPQWEMPDLFDDLRDEYSTNGFWVAHTSGCQRLDGETDEARLARMNAVASVYPEDVRIWQHQRFVEPPSLQTEEAALFRALRSWLRAFEPKPGDYFEPKPGDHGAA